MANPGDLDVAFQYARLSAEAGDLEGAIATLERMLIFAPGLPRLQLELGVLYFRLGSDAAARGYLDAAVAGPDVPPEVRAKVERYIADIDERSAEDTLHGNVMIGGRYQTNANGGPNSKNVTLNGLEFILNDAAIGAGDTSGFVQGNVLYSHDLASQGDRFDVNLVGYGSLYSQLHENDTALAELTFGPVFNLERIKVDGAELGFYGILGGVMLDGDPYLASGGIGASLSKALDLDTRAFVQGEYRLESFQDSRQRERASDRTGDRFRLNGTLQHQLTDRLSIFAAVEGERRNADRGYLSDWEYGGSVGAALAFSSPFPTMALPWTGTLKTGVLRREFDEPDPIIDVLDAQEDDEFFVQGVLTAPVFETVAVQGVVGYRNVDSNYDLRAYDDFNVSLALIKSF